MRAQDGTIAGDSIRELVSLSKKLAAVREPPRVVGVQGATRSGMSSDLVGQDRFGDVKADSREAPSSASLTWQEQRVLNAHLEREWKEGQGRAAKALTTLLGGGESGESAVSDSCAYEQKKHDNIFLFRTWCSQNFSKLKL